MYKDGSTIGNLMCSSCTSFRKVAPIEYTLICHCLHVKFKFFWFYFNCFRGMIWTHRDWCLPIKRQQNPSACERFFPFYRQCTGRLPLLLMTFFLLWNYWSLLNWKTVEQLECVAQPFWFEAGPPFQRFFDVHFVESVLLALGLQHEWVQISLMILLVLIDWVGLLRLVLRMDIGAKNKIKPEVAETEKPSAMAEPEPVSVKVTSETIVLSCMTLPQVTQTMCPSRSSVSVSVGPQLEQCWSIFGYFFFFFPNSFPEVFSFCVDIIIEKIESKPHGNQKRGKFESWDNLYWGLAILGYALSETPSGAYIRKPN